MRPVKRMKTEAPSLGAAAALPDEIVTEVLLRLPIKSLLRFRAVCRSWAATLSSEEFCALHMAKGAPLRLLHVAAATAACDATALYSCSPAQAGPRSAADLLLTIDDLKGDFVDGVGAECRGLTLLYDAVAPAYYVVNPATRAFTRLPPCEDVMYSSAGLGFDARAKAYKVMRLFVGHRGGAAAAAPVCQVYTLGGSVQQQGDCWRPSAGTIPSNFACTVLHAVKTAARNHLPPVLANGSLHWLVDHGYAVHYPAAPTVVTFSVTDETFGWLQPLPFSTLGVHLVELDGCLCAVRDLRYGSSSDDHCSSSAFLEIWKLRDHKAGVWFLDTRIDMSRYNNSPIDLYRPWNNVNVRVLGALLAEVGSARKRKIIMATSNHTVHVYDVVSGDAETIVVPFLAGTTADASKQRLSAAPIRVSLFRESLAPVHKTQEEIYFSSPQAMATKEVLLRLPARSVVMLKLVCSQWRGLIEDKSFTRSYFAHKRMEKPVKIVLVGKGTPGRSLLSSARGTAERLFFDFASLELEIGAINNNYNKGAWLDAKVVCSRPCHGLNLLCTANMDYLYNPSTGYCKTNAYSSQLAPASWETPNTDVWRVVPDNAFALGNKIVGLGFNPEEQEHVAVEVLYESKDFRTRGYRATCAVWHCRTGSMQSGFNLPLPVNDMPPAYVAGMLYWMSDPRLGPLREHAIVSFDIAKQEFDVIPCPSYLAKWRRRIARRLYVVELWEKLCIVVADVAADELVVWKMLDHGEWDRACTVRLSASPSYSLVSNMVMPLVVDHKDDRILLSTGKRIGYYDPESETIDELYATDEILCSPKMAGAEVYQDYQSAVPPIPMLYEESLITYPRHVRSHRFM